MTTEQPQECEVTSRIRSLVRQHYYRNKHLSPVHDVDDLFQDAWIHAKTIESDNVPDSHPSKLNPEETSETNGMSQEQTLRRAVGRAASRAFGKLRKRQSRGTATQVALEFDPADCLPDFASVIDLRNQIESLPDEERLVIELLRCGYDGIEIAKVLGLSTQAVFAAQAEGNFQTASDPARI